MTTRDLSNRPAPNPRTHMTTPRSLIKLQPWLTLVGAAAAPDVVQPARDWLTSQDASAYGMQVDVAAVSGCTLVVETGVTVEGPWRESSSYTAVGWSVGNFGYLRSRVLPCH